MHVLAHGGAGSAPDNPRTRRESLRAATAAGADTGTPKTAVVATVRHLESDPQFNAGVGIAVQSDGTIRTDAGLMTGDGTAGAACAMPGVEHAVEVEAIARFGLARRAVAAVEDGAAPAGAAGETIERFAAETSGTAGVIVLGRSGTTGEAHNAEAMQTATHGDQ